MEKSNYGGHFEKNTTVLLMAILKYGFFELSFIELSSLPSPSFPAKFHQALQPAFRPFLPITSTPPIALHQTLHPAFLQASSMPSASHPAGRLQAFQHAFSKLSFKELSSRLLQALRPTFKPSSQPLGPSSQLLQPLQSPFT
jgi:hypothetical protein